VSFHGSRACVLRTDQNTEDENQQLLFNHINEQIQKNAQLVEENEHLENQLHAQARGTESASEPEDQAAPATTLPGDEYRQLSEKFNEMKRKYQDITQKIRYLERKNQVVMQKNKDMKESVRAWQEYADRTSGKIKLRGDTMARDGPSRLASALQAEDNGSTVSSPVPVDTDQLPRPPADLGRSSPPAFAPLADTETDFLRRSKLPETPGGNHSRPSSSGSITPKPAVTTERTDSRASDSSRVNPFLRTATRLEDERRVYSELHEAPPTSSQTTVDEHPEQPAHTVGTDDDDDIPQFVSERSLKRKRGPSTKFAIYTDRSTEGTPAKPFRVKDEPPSSPPSVVHTLLRKETIDLDEPAPNLLLTPRHRKRGAPLHSNSTGISRHQRSNSAPFSQTIGNEDYQDLHGPSDGLSHIQARFQAAVDSRALSEPFDPSLSSVDVLRAIDPNVVLESTEEASSKRQKHGSNHRRSKYAALAESGEEPPMDENMAGPSSHLARAHVNQRQRAAKNPKTPAKALHLTSTSAPAKIKLEQMPTPPSSSRPTYTPSRGSSLRSGMSHARSNPPDDMASDNRPIWSMKASEKRANPRREPAVSSEKQTPLRTKPVQELRIQDFRPNPAFNQGYSYAFSETVRKRGDRMCLPGCTNAQCCGSTFRTLAEAQAPLPPSQEEALLEEYLGDAYDHMVSTQMAVEERAELVLQARTKKMAKENGKHREAYERRRTPPGFWRVDFPTTQEQQEDRARAKELEIKAVEERWLEAQRKGGRWIFRDE
jgi:hypothetical protein